MKNLLENPDRLITSAKTIPKFTNLVSDDEDEILHRNQVNHEKQDEERQQKFKHNTHQKETKSTLL